MTFFCAPRWKHIPLISGNNALLLEIENAGHRNRTFETKPSCWSLRTFKAISVHGLRLSCSACKHDGSVVSLFGFVRASLTLPWGVPWDVLFPSRHTSCCIPHQHKSNTVDNVLFNSTSSVEQDFQHRHRHYLLGDLSLMKTNGRLGILSLALYLPACPARLLFLVVAETKPRTPIFVLNPGVSPPSSIMAYLFQHANLLHTSSLFLVTSGIWWPPILNADAEYWFSYWGPFPEIEVRAASLKEKGFPHLPVNGRMPVVWVITWNVWETEEEEGIAGFNMKNAYEWNWTEIQICPMDFRCQV